ncbi:MAG: FAD-dependent oxidoreductase, partial [Kiritimatiellia bacterium]
VREVDAGPIWPAMPEGWSATLPDIPLAQREQDRHFRDAPMPQGWCADSVSAKCGMYKTSIWPDGPGGKALKLWLPTVDSTDTESMTAAEIQARRCMVEATDYFQRIANKPWRLDHAAPMVAIRDGALIRGDYVLKTDDLLAGRAFDDGVARGTYILHLPPYPDGIDYRAVKPYQIPLRSLIARDGCNLLMAGRNLSADRVAQSSVRVATSGCMMGQAVGIAAALAAGENVDPRNLDPADVRVIVKERGGMLEV